MKDLVIGIGLLAGLFLILLWRGARHARKEAIRAEELVKWREEIDRRRRRDEQITQ